MHFSCDSRMPLRPRLTVSCTGAIKLPMAPARSCTRQSSGTSYLLRDGHGELNGHRGNDGFSMPPGRGVCRQQELGRKTLRHIQLYSLHATRPELRASLVGSLICGNVHAQCRLSQPNSISWPRFRYALPGYRHPDAVANAWWCMYHNWKSSRLNLSS